MALPLLPEGEIEMSFLTLSQQVLPISAQEKKQFKLFLNYVKKQWMTEVGPNLLSVFQVVSRTNNICEVCMIQTILDQYLI